MCPIAEFFEESKIMSVRVLLDTNIVIHREVAKPNVKDIGVLYRWLDNLHYLKCVHPVTVQELNKLTDPTKRLAYEVKLSAYNILQVPAPLNIEVQNICAKVDSTPNDFLDAQLLNEVFLERVDFLITEDKKIHRKAALLNVADRVFKIDSFLEKVTAENPSLVSYKVPSEPVA
jgi:predicted nucleic acid-binding protein